MSTVISWLPYKAVVVIGKGMGHLYHKIAKKQRVRAEETIRERLGYSQEQAEATIKSLFVKLGITFMEIMYMPALNKDNIRGLVTFCHIPLLTDAAGRRLSKRDGDLEIAALRQHFGSPEPIIGLLAYLAGQLSKPEPITAAELLPLFRPESVPHDNIVVPQLL